MMLLNFAADWRFPSNTGSVQLEFIAVSVRSLTNPDIGDITKVMFAMLCRFNKLEICQSFADYTLFLHFAVSGGISPSRRGRSGAAFQLAHSLCGLLGLLAGHLHRLIVSLDARQQGSPLILRAQLGLLIFRLQLCFALCKALHLLLQNTSESSGHITWLQLLLLTAVWVQAWC